MEVSFHSQVNTNFLCHISVSFSIEKHVGLTGIPPELGLKWKMTNGHRLEPLVVKVEATFFSSGLFGKIVEN